MRQLRGGRAERRSPPGAEGFGIGIVASWRVVFGDELLSENHDVLFLAMNGTTAPAQFRVYPMTAILQHGYT